MRRVRRYTKLGLWPWATRHVARVKMKTRRKMKKRYKSMLVRSAMGRDRFKVKPWYVS